MYFYQLSDKQTKKKSLKNIAHSSLFKIFRITFFTCMADFQGKGL